MDLLERSTGPNGEFIRGHQYNSDGRAAAYIASGEAYVVYHSYSPRVTEVLDEVRDSTFDFEISGQRVDSVSDQCACSGDRFEAEWSSGKRVAVILPDPSSTQAGTRVLYDGRDGIYENWTGAAPSTTPDYEDRITDPLRITHFVYDEDVRGGIPVTEVGDPHSVICPDYPTGWATDWGVTCGGQSSEWPRLVYDHDTAYDSTPNNAVIADNVRRIIQHGATVDPSDLDTAESRVRRVEYSYGSNGEVTSLVTHVDEGVSRTITRTYHSSGTNAGLLEKIKLGATSPVTVEERGSYDAWGRPGWFDDERGVRRNYTYDVDGNITQVSLSYSSSTLRTLDLSYDAEGHLTQLKISGGGDNIVQDLVYGPPSTLPQPDDTSPDFCDLQDLSSSAVAGAQADCVDALGYLSRPRELTLGVDDSGTTDALAFFDLERGEDGQVTQIIEGSTASPTLKHTLEYDDAGNLIRSFKFVGSTTSADYVKEYYYNLADQLTGVADERHTDVSDSHSTNESDKNRTLTYDALGRISSVSVGVGTTESATIDFAYDAHGNLAKVTDANDNETEYLYDDFGNLIAVKSPDSGTTRYGYDDYGNLLKEEDESGRTAEYTYDSRDRVLSETHTVGSEDSVVLYGYDDFTGSGASPGASCGNIDFDPDLAMGVGRRTWVLHDSGSTFYSYDELGQVIASYDHPGSGFDPCSLRITRYAYDDLGRTTTMTTPSGRRVRYDYSSTTANDAPVLPSSVHVEEKIAGDWVALAEMTDLAYDGAGYRTDFDSGALTFESDFDFSGQAKYRTYTSTTGDDFDWQITTRDGSGNIELVEDDATNKSLTLEYDGQDRLDSALGSRLRGYQDCDYVYDDAGNREEETCYGTERRLEYTTDTNSLDEIEWDRDATACGSAGTVSRAVGRDSLGRTTSFYAGRYGDSTDQITLSYGLNGRLVTLTRGGESWTYFYDHRNLRRYPR